MLIKSNLHLLFSLRNYSESIVLSINTVTAEAVIRVGVDIGGYKEFQSAYLDITFEFDRILHTYKIKHVDFAYDDGANSYDFYLEGYCEEHGTHYITP